MTNESNLDTLIIEESLVASSQRLIAWTFYLEDKRKTYKQGIHYLEIIIATIISILMALFFAPCFDIVFLYNNLSLYCYIWFSLSYYVTLLILKPNESPFVLLREILIYSLIVYFAILLGLKLTERLNSEEAKYIVKTIARTASIYITFDYVLKKDV